MGRQCDGFDRDAMLARNAALIAEHGYMVMGVKGSYALGRRDWAYTIGLLDCAGHPELICAGVELREGARLLTAIGQRVLAGERFEAGQSVSTAGGVASLGAVDPIQFRLGTFNAWLCLAEIDVVHSRVLHALQVFAPDWWFCPEHRHAQPVLAHPHERVDVAHRPNRSTRRLARGLG